MFDGHGWHGGGGEWIVMALLMVIFWAAVVAVVVALVHNNRHHSVGPSVQPNPYGNAHELALSLLAERFARGEIDADEYAARRDLLRRP